MSGRQWLTTMMMMAMALAVACGDGDSGDDKGGDGDGDGDGDNSLPSVECGATTCDTTTEDDAWGGEACCVKDDVCGVKSDAPSVVNPLDNSQIPISTVLGSVGMFDPALAEMVKNTNPTIDCLEKNQPGEESDQCPSESISLGGMAGDADAGMDGMTGMEINAVGCCRPDGMCGFIDETGTIGGCVKISDSLLGRIGEMADVECTP